MGNEKKRESIHFNKYLDIKVLWMVQNWVEFLLRYYASMLSEALKKVYDIV